MAFGKFVSMIGGALEKQILRRSSSTIEGAYQLMCYAGIGSVVETITALPRGQIPLFAGFTVELPWTIEEQHYIVGTPGLSPDLQVDAMLAGQRVVPWLPIRTHTTGLIDWGVRQNVPGAREALELIHPGRTALILQEREGDWPMSDTVTIHGDPLRDPRTLSEKEWMFDPRNEGGSELLISGNWGPSDGVVERAMLDEMDPGLASSAMGLASAPGGSSGGLIQDYTEHSIRRIR